MPSDVDASNPLLESITTCPQNIAENGNTSANERPMPLNDVE
jgi:hypothetical protein